MGYAQNTNTASTQTTDHTALLANYSKEQDVLFEVLAKAMPGMLKGKDKKLSTELDFPKELQIPKDLDIAQAEENLKIKKGLGTDYEWQKAELLPEEKMPPVEYILSYVNKGPSNKENAPVKVLQDKVLLYAMEEIQPSEEPYQRPEVQAGYPERGASRVGPDSYDRERYASSEPRFDVDAEAVKIIEEELSEKECEKLLTTFLGQLSREASKV